MKVMHVPRPRKVCARCGAHRLQSQFYMNRGKPRPECKSCTVEARTQLRTAKEEEAHGSRASEK